MDEKISLVINTLNEEKNIAACIESAQGLYDEVVIVDMHSDDKTREIAERYTDKIFLHDRLGYADPARNFALSKATGEWVLVLDADERLTPELRDELRKIARGNQADVVWINYRTFFFGKEIKECGWRNDWHARFFKKGFLQFSEMVHALPTITGREVRMRDVPSMKILHYNYVSIEQWIRKMNNYTTAEANRYKYKYARRFSFSFATLHAGKEFARRFIYERGYRDGQLGLIVCMMQSMYVLFAWFKLWEMEKNNESQIVTQ